MTELFGFKNIFDNPKPEELVRGLIQISNAKSGDIVMDFFAGSSVLAHAVYQMNIEDKLSLNYLCVQIAEVIKNEEEAFKAGYKTIAEIGKERIRRVIKKIKKEENDKFKLDLGFKVFKLKNSNFKIWRGDVIDNQKDLEKQMDMLKDPVKPEAQQKNMLWELLLKTGYDLNTSIGEKKIGKNLFYIIANGETVIMLSPQSEKSISEIIKIKPQKVICLDNIFKGDDQLKTNTALQMKDAEIEFRTV